MRLPVALGLNVILNVQVAPTAIFDGQSFVSVKSCQLPGEPLTLPNTGCGSLPVLVSVTLVGALVVLTI